MDRWVDAEDYWLARVTIIRQLRFKAATDTDRLLHSCTRRAAEFFIRTAIGWALREYAKTDPEAVVAYARGHESELSPLSRREALRRNVLRSRRASSMRSAERIDDASGQHLPHAPHFLPHTVAGGSTCVDRSLLFSAHWR